MNAAYPPMRLFGVLGTKLIARIVCRAGLFIALVGLTFSPDVWPDWTERRLPIQAREPEPLFTNANQAAPLTSTRGGPSPGTMKLSHITAPTTWQWVPSGLSSNHIIALAIAPTDPDILYAGTGHYIFKTTDGGATWNEVHFGFAAYSLAIHPTNADIVYAGQFGYEVLKTINGGLTWVELPSIGASTHTALAIDPANTNTVYAGISDGWGVYKTTNGGAGWSNVLDSTDVTSLAIDPANTNVIYVGTEGYYDVAGGVLKSVNGGADWTRAMTNTQVNALAIDPANTDVVYAGTEGDGIFKSVDGGVNWTSVNTGLTYTIVRALAIDPTNTDVVYAGTWEGGVFRSTDGGASWSSFNTGLINTYILSLALDPVDASVLYAGTEGGGVFKVVLLTPPSLTVTKQADPGLVQAGSLLTYTIRVTNTGGVDLHATITDTLPTHVTTGGTAGGTTVLPGGKLVWTPFIAAPGGTWVRTVVVTAEVGYNGPLTNVVQVTTEEGAAGVYTETSTAAGLADITVAPLSLGATLNPGGAATRTLTIGNVGTADLNWSLTEDPAAGWLDEMPSDGTIPPAESDDVVVVFDATGLTDGVYATTLGISSDDPDESVLDVPVVLTVTAAPILSTTIQFESSTYSEDEGAGAAAITVTLDAASDLTVTVDYATSDGTATAGSDYTAAGGRLSFIPGITSQVFTVVITDDTQYENDETINLALSNPTNANLGTPAVATLTIKNDDEIPGCPHPLSDVSISGPTEGYTGTLYTFTTVITPSDATEPITYTWSPTPTLGQGKVSASYRWDTSGPHVISLRAENCGAPAAVAVSDTHTITISATPPPGDAYEPDDTCAQARPIPTDGSVQVHTFHATGDEDWAFFEVVSGTEYLIEAVTPVDSLADVSLELYDTCGAVPTRTQDHSFSPDVRLLFTAPVTGTLKLRLRNSVPDTAGTDVSYHLSVRSLAETASPGALVLVAGRLKLGDPLQDNIHNVTNGIYNLFLEHGYPKDRIYYLATNLSMDADGNGFPDDVDAAPDRTTLETVITTWAAGKQLGPERAFTLYLTDHGGGDKFYLNGPSQTVSPDDLDAWLSTLEAAAPGVRVNVIMEACHSGSFVDSLGKQGRVVIASTAAHAVAYASQDGAIFSDTFLEALERGLSLFGSFQEAQWDAVTAHPDQISWLDDDGDGWPNTASDGLEASRRGFAYAGTFAAEEKWPPYVVWAHVRDLQDNEGVIEAEVRDDQRVDFAWAVIYKPSYTPPDPDVTEEMPKEILSTVTLLDPESDGIYSARYEGFDEVGEYRLVIYATDNEDLDARPRAVELVTGASWEMYLPVVVRSS